MGYTYEYIDDYMTIPRLNAMAAYWKENPPLHQMVAQYLEMGSSKKAPKAETSEVELEKQSQELMGLVGSLGLSSEKPEWLKTTT